MKHTIVVVSYLLLIFSCQKSEEELNTKNKSPLFGKWNWVKTIYYWPNHTQITPISSNYMEFRMFDATQLKIYRNDTLYMEYEYNITKIDTIDGEIKGELLYDSIKPFFIIYLDTLTISQTELDGPAEFFVRIPK